MKTIKLSRKTVNLIGWMCESAFWLVLLGITVLLAFSSCDKETDPEVIIPTDSIVDVAGNVYTVVKIGDDWWMAENLATTKFRDGSAIEQAQNNAEGWALGNAAYCRYEDNALAPGLLYNWSAVNHNAQLAPAGWHIATEAEWQALERHLGMNAEDVEKISWRESGACGDKLKVKGPNGWLGFEGVWGTNESGFSALAGGCRLVLRDYTLSDSAWVGKWSTPGLNYAGYWWTATEKDTYTAYFRNLDHKKSGTFRFYVDKRYGMSVRCVKDK